MTASRPPDENDRSSQHNICNCALKMGLRSPLHLSQDNADEFGQSIVLAVNVSSQIAPEVRFEGSHKASLRFSLFFDVSPIMLIRFSSYQRKSSSHTREINRGSQNGRWLEAGVDIERSHRSCLDTPTTVELLVPKSIPAFMTTSPAISADKWIAASKMVNGL